jgi:uncharacterized delta-60 repeat protein
MTRSFSTNRQTPPKPRRTFCPQAEGLEGRQLLSAGALDTTFNSTGYVLAGPLSAQAVTIQPQNGDILAAGEVYPTSTGGDFRVVALTPSGALDPSFASGGSVTTDFAGKEDRPQAMAVMPDGRIVVAGWADTGTGKVKGNPVYNYDFAVARYLPSGALDSSFGGGTGKVTTNISTYHSTDTFNERDEANAVVLQDDGKIVVGGYSYTAQGTTEGVLVRYNTDGTLDTSFGQGGVVQINLPSFTSDGVWGLAIWRDPTTGTDKIVTMEAPQTSSGYSVGVARYNLDGSLDASFGTNGRTVTTVSGASLGGWGIALQSDGSVVVTGDYQYANGNPQDTFLLRYTAAGVLDSTFGNDGIAVFDAGGSDVGYSVAIQPSDGKILVAGYSSLTNGSAYVARFQTDGAIDATFGSNGEALNTFSNAGSSFHGLAVQSDGKIVAVGGATSTSGKTTTKNFLIARFLGDTTTPTAAARARASVSTTAAMSQDSLPQLALAPLADQDLTALAVERIGAGKRRRGLPVS